MNDSQKITFSIFLYTFIMIAMGIWIRLAHWTDPCGLSEILCLDSFHSESKTLLGFVSLYRILSFSHGIIMLLYFLKIRKLTKYANAVLVFSLLEAFFGSRLMMLYTATENDIFIPALVSLFHQINILALLATLILIFIHLDEKRKNLIIPNAFYLYVFIFITSTGALSTYIESISDLIKQDFLPTTEIFSFLSRIRISHAPISIIIGGASAFYFFIQYYVQQNASLKMKSLCLTLSILLGLFLGLMNLNYRNTVEIKFIHSLFSYVIFYFLIDWIYTDKKSLNGK